MGNIDNKEKEFAEILKLVTRTARENRNVISKEQVDLAFSELDLDDKQLAMVYEYLKNHKIGVGQEAAAEDNFTEEEKNYLDDYIDSLKGLNRLTDGEIEAVQMAAINGDKIAQSQLIENYLPLVVDVLLGGLDAEVLVGGAGVAVVERQVVNAVGGHGPGQRGVVAVAGVLLYLAHHARVDAAR